LDKDKNSRIAAQKPPEKKTGMRPGRCVCERNQNKS
jgi:hypothetical protein